VVIDIGEAKSSIVADMDPDYQPNGHPAIHIEATTATMRRLTAPWAEAARREQQAKHWPNIGSRSIKKPRS
jgi:hypothetical protein